METLVKPEQGSSTSTYYVWEVPDKNIIIHLDYGVVDRLLIEVMRGFGAIPRRGAEVGGILLGSTEPAGDKTIVRVEEFEPVTCEHRRGPSYLLSEGDTNRYEETLQRHRATPEKRLYAIGGYRSHTREGMGMSAEDLKLYDSYFPESNAIFLLVKPYATRVSVAGFFFREGQRVQTEATYLEFPFRRRELGGGASPAGRLRDSPGVSAGIGSAHTSFSAPAGGVADAPPVDYAEYDERPFYPSHVEEEYPVEASEAAPEPSVTRFRKTNVWIPLSFIFLLLGVLVGFQAALSYKPAKAAGVLSDPFSMTLAVSRSGDYLHVRWDRHSQAVRTAQRGVLTITESGYEKKVDLDAIQLQNPTVYYRNVSDGVKFRLEVFTKERVSVSENFEWHR
jgi:hypothetical protein